MFAKFSFMKLADTPHVGHPNLCITMYNGNLKSMKIFSNLLTIVKLRQTTCYQSAQGRNLFIIYLLECTLNSTRKKPLADNWALHKLQGACTLFHHDS